MPRYDCSDANLLGPGRNGEAKNAAVNVAARPIRARNAGLVLA
jgi:hypothetical protein